jgi:V/A-type H+-transporting ATPase subunit I
VEKLKYLNDFKYLYDYYNLENTKLDIIKQGRETSKVFVLDAWVPEPQAKLTLDALLETIPSINYVLRDPVGGETPPSFVKNSKPVAAFGDVITATFGAPKYGGIEPNVFVAFFYFLFFGFMLGDAGYGVLMATFCFGYLLIKKPVKNSGNFMLMFGLCGISTILWGAFFGGWFGLEASVLEGGAFGRFLLSLQQIDSLNGTQTLIMFGIALGLGVVHIATGFALNGISKLKTKPLDGIMNDFSWVIVFIGGAIYGLDFLLKTGVLNTIGIVTVLLGVAMLCIGGALGKKNPIKMLTGAFGNLYGSINIFSDILSYARLFGLGLTTGIIGMVVNRIGGIFIDMIPYYLGYVIAVPIWIIGHTFNLAINILGVYVHNSRLQYVEFFGKFYSGEGKAFKPFGGQTKYIFLRDSLSEKTK